MLLARSANVRTSGNPGGTPQTVSDPAHVEAAKLLRRKHLNVTRQPRPSADPEVEIRCLADYDTALGLADEGVA